MSRGTTQAFRFSLLICRPCTGRTKPRESLGYFWLRVARFVLNENSQIPQGPVQTSHPGTIRGVFHPFSEVEAIQIAERAEAAGPITPQDRPRAANRSGRRFSLRAPLAQQRKSHPFRRSYHVFSSNRRQSHSCQTRLPCTRAAAAAASAPSGHLTHRQSNKEGSPEGRKNGLLSKISTLILMGVSL